MGTERLIEEYIRGALELDMDKMDNFDKVKYVKTKNLIDDLLNTINDYVLKLHLMEKVRQQIKEAKR